MFTKFRVRNFKTHLDTEIELKDLTLLIGSNNSGKTNLLKAISFFSEIARNSMYASEEYADLGLLENSKKVLGVSDYLKYKHDLSEWQPIIFSCEWVLNTPQDFKINYELVINPTTIDISFEETVIFNMSGEDKFFEGGEGKELTIWKKVKEKKITDWHFLHFWNDLITNRYFSFQVNSIESKNQNSYNKDFFEERSFLLDKGIKEQKLFNLLNSSTMLGSEGENFVPTIKYIKAFESTQYNKFISYLRRFEVSFVGIDIKDDTIKWQFDTGKGDLASYDSTDISDGLLKAAAVALLCASEKKPAVIMLEEIENGINQSKIQEFLEWLKHVSDNGKNTQFILTSHSPSVIREFSDNLDSVYTFHLKRKKGYVSEVTNLNEALKMINRLGGLKEESVEEVDGVLHIRKYALTELFYNGILGEL
jgi:AAA15 family ATPase/GTPase